MEGSIKPHVQFEVEKVIGVSSDGTYQVQWAPVWVSSFHLIGCEHLIQEFLQRQSKKVKPHKRQQQQDTQSSHDLRSPQLSTQEKEFCISDEQTYTTNYDTRHYTNHQHNYEMKSSDHREHSAATTSSSEISTKDIETEIDAADPLEHTNRTVSEEPVATNDSVFVKIEEEDCCEITSFSSSSKTNANGRPFQRSSSVVLQTYKERCSSLSPTRRMGDTRRRRDFSSSPSMVDKHTNDITSENSMLSIVDTIRNHDNGQQISDEIYTCTVCNESFCGIFALEQHLLTNCDNKHQQQQLQQQQQQQQQQQHCNDKRFECGTCGRQFAKKCHLEQHKLTHLVEKPFECSTCGKTFTRRANMKEHERVHTGARPYLCSICSQTFKHYSSYSKHRKLCDSTLVKGGNVMG